MRQDGGEGWGGERMDGDDMSRSIRLLTRCKALKTILNKCAMNALRQM